MMLSSDVIVSTLISAPLTAIVAIVVARMGRNFQFKQDSLRFAIQAALKEFEIHCQLAQHNNRNDNVIPFPVYLIYYLQLMKEDLKDYFIRQNYQ